MQRSLISHLTRAKAELLERDLLCLPDIHNTEFCMSNAFPTCVAMLWWYYVDMKLSENHE